MIELAQKFPTQEILERIAKALGPTGMFSMPIAEARLRKFQKTVLIDLEKAVTQAVTQVIERNLGVSLG
jgi:hypothetical protein